MSPARGDAPSHLAMGPGGEFDLIRTMMARWGTLAVGLGDDAAQLPGDPRTRVVSVDAAVDGVHFRRGWLTPQEIGGRAAAAALSDLAAMGASVEAVLLALIVPPSWDADVPALADGFGEVVQAAGGRIVGGNLSRGETLSITTTVIGTVARAITREGARPGDLLCVTGTLGGPGAALAAWTAGAVPSDWARARFARPVPRIAEGQALAEAGARAMLDLSDGLVSDSRHLAAASGVSVVMHPEQLPVGQGITPETALASGEEYELLVAMPPAAVDALRPHWDAQQQTPLTIIGEVQAASVEHPAGTVRVIPRNSQSAVRVEFATGHDHFSPS